VTPRRWALAVPAGAAVLLAACSSPSTPRAASTTTTAHRATTTSAPTTTTTSTTAPPATTSTAASTACTRVTATAGQSQGAAGTITGVITVANAGSTSCTVDGYPTIALFSGSGAPLTVTVVNGLSVTLTPPANAAPSVVTVAPSSTAQFAYQFSDVPVGAETSCPTSEAATVTMPGTTAASPTFSLAIDPCDNGTIRVSPVYAG
jgi:Protein of unknown function (DUF4232)